MGRGSLRDSLDKTIDVNNVINGKGYYPGLLSGRWVIYAIQWSASLISKLIYLSCCRLQLE